MIYKRRVELGDPYNADIERKLVGKEKIEDGIILNYEVRTIGENKEPAQEACITL